MIKSCLFPIAVAFGVLLNSANCAAQSTVDGGLPHQVGSNATVPAADFYDVGVKYGLGINHISQANRTGRNSDPLVLPLSRILPAKAPSSGLVVNVAERMVYVFRDGKFEKFFPVAIGSGGRFATPTGDCKIIEKVKHPTWSPPAWAGLGEGTVVAAGPDNPLGERWIGLSFSGLGFHGTTMPTSVGSAASHGCMRMYSVSVRDLFERVEVGWPVRLEYETARVGQSKDGTVSLVAFPDVYGLKSPASELHRLLTAHGIADLVPSEKVLQVGGSATGLAVPVLEGGQRLLYGASAIAPEPFRPNLLKAPQGLLISADGLSHLGCAVEFDKASRSLLVQRTVRLKKALPQKQQEPGSSEPSPAPVNGTVPQGQLTPEPVSTPVPVPASTPDQAFEWVNTTYRVQATYQEDALGSYAGDQVMRAYLVGAQSFVPVREVLPMLDLTYQWDAKTKTLSTYPKTQTSTK